ncbi:MAG: hypothetical protein ACW7DR_12265 [Paraglaciecola chathamensis]
MSLTEVFPQNFGQFGTYALLLATTSVVIYSTFKSLTLKSQLTKTKTQLSSAQQYTLELVEKYKPIMSIESHLRELSAEATSTAANIESLRET